MAQSVKHPTLDFHSGHDLSVHEFQPLDRFCADSAQPAWDSLSPFLSAPPVLVCSLPLSLKTNKLKKLLPENIYSTENITKCKCYILKCYPH